MKKTLAVMSLSLGLGLLCLQAQAAKQLTPLWQTADLPTPESVLYVADKKTPYLFVSLIDGQGDAADGKGGIAKLSPQGELLDKNWITGLNAPKGMALYQDRLYVADITELVVIDTKAQKVVEKIAVEGAVFLNDVAVSAEGVVYVSDTRTQKVHRLQQGKLDLYLAEVASANGLQVIGDTLIVGAGPELIAVDAEKQRRVIASGFESGIDGIEHLGDNEFLVSCWVGLVYYVHKDGRLERLIDSRDEKINTADIGYDPHHKHLFVPNFFKDRVTAYQLQ